jgi:hypothetical protein
MLKKVLLPLGVLALAGVAQSQVVYSQAPTGANDGSLAVVDLNHLDLVARQELADDFTLGTDTDVTDVSFWGFMINSANNGAGFSNLSGFRIQFFDDSGGSGAPGTMIAQQTLVFGGLTPHVTATFFAIGPNINNNAFPASTYRFDAALPAAVFLPDGHYWISINAIQVSDAVGQDLFNWSHDNCDPPDTAFIAPGNCGVQGRAVDGGPSDLGHTTPNGTWVLVGGTNQAFQLVGTPGVDSDTDGDGLLDSTEIELAEIFTCLDPFNADSDGDGLADGQELVGPIMVSNPCLVDSDGDGLNDNVDPNPLDPGGSQSEIESFIRTTVPSAATMPLVDFDATNENSAGGKRGAIANKLNSAANFVAEGDYAAALDVLTDLSAKIDGDPAVKDWMNIDSEARQTLYETVQAQIDIILTLL